MPFFCYLIQSCATEHSKACYIGFSTFPYRRLRQHNGEIKSGARKTSFRRPWKHVVIVSGFPNNKVALQFEWQWQHPAESRIFRKNNNKTISLKYRNIKTHLSILLMMLRSSYWCRLNLSLHFTEYSNCQIFRSIEKLEPNCSMQSVLMITTSDVERIHCVETASIVQTVTTDPTIAIPLAICALCESADAKKRRWSCARCGTTMHLVCSAELNAKPGSFIPEFARCACCSKEVPWSQVVHSSNRLASAERSAATAPESAATDELVDLTEECSEEDEAGYFSPEPDSDLEG